MNNYTTIDDIYEKSNIPDIDIYIENITSLKLEQKDYKSVICTLSNTVEKLLNIMINITNIQIDEYKENNQNNIIKMTRYIDFSKKAHDDMKKKVQDFENGISYIKNLRATYVDYVYTSPVASIYITYNYDISSYTLIYDNINYNMGTCKFPISRGYKNNGEQMNMHRHLLNKLYEEDVDDSIIQLLQFSSSIIIKTLNSKKNTSRLLNH